MSRAATPVVFVATESYALGLAAALASIARHTSPCPPIFAVDAGLAAESRSKMEQVARITWLDGTGIAAELRGLLPDPGEEQGRQEYAAPGCWLKLFLPRLLPPGATRAMYMDCDTIALDDLGPLLSADLQGHLLAAVQDFGLPCGHEALQAAGWCLLPGRPYFNTGVVLLDCAALRRSEVEACRLIREHGSSVLRYHDQDVLNLLASAPGGPGWLPLDPLWNAQGLGSYARFRCTPEPGRPALFDAAGLAALEAAPKVVHFTGPHLVLPSDYLNPHVPHSAKPWAYLCPHPFRGAFFQLLDSTPWAGWRPQQAQVAEAATADILQFLRRVWREHSGFDGTACLHAIMERLQQALQ